MKNIQEGYNSTGIYPKMEITKMNILILDIFFFWIFHHKIYLLQKKDIFIGIFGYITLENKYDISRNLDISSYIHRWI